MLQDGAGRHGHLTIIRIKGLLASRIQNSVPHTRLLYYITKHGVRKWDIPIIFIHE